MGIKNKIRPERPEDRAAIRRVNEEAFGRPAEADLVDALRVQADPFLSFVAERAGEVVGHLCFSPVRVDDVPSGTKALGLAPMTVLPALQGRGIGTALARHGLDECRRCGIDFVVVLGHPDYYPRFGFEPAAAHGLTSAYPAPEEAFMVIELRPGALEETQGVVRYHPAFASV